MKKREEGPYFRSPFWFFAWFWRIWVRFTAYQTEFLEMISAVR